jgi:hypothetical protein
MTLNIEILKLIIFENAVLYTLCNKSQALEILQVLDLKRCKRTAGIVISVIRNLLVFASGRHTIRCCEPTPSVATRIIPTPTKYFTLSEEEEEHLDPYDMMLANRRRASRHLSSRGRHKISNMAKMRLSMPHSTMLANWRLSSRRRHMIQNEAKRSLRTSYDTTMSPRLTGTQPNPN